MAKKSRDPRNLSMDDLVTWSGDMDDWLEDHAADPDLTPRAACPYNSWSGNLRYLAIGSTTLSASQFSTRKSGGCVLDSTARSILYSGGAELFRSNYHQNNLEKSLIYRNHPLILILLWAIKLSEAVLNLGLKTTYRIWRES